MTSPLDELIEKLRRAEGPSVPLFMEAYYAVFGPWPDQPSYEQLIHRARFIRLLEAEGWTDAAMTLVPEGCGATVINDPTNGHHSASVYAKDVHASERAATPTLALCIAALSTKGAG